MKEAYARKTINVHLWGKRTDEGRGGRQEKQLKMKKINPNQVPTPKGGTTNTTKCTNAAKGHRQKSTGQARGEPNLDKNDKRGKTEGDRV